ncbi:HIT family protein [Aspergillus affinis]|uniref:HIT family protein n=1 Tax=Aspergillus affinis TaxID=1070780 RepID=UPI0022FDBAEA|nr:HIT-like protein [Aspergillus affinis]KAI9042908.1 HIT-like protein [Aspergillus affinis]
MFTNSSIPDTTNMSAALKGTPIHFGPFLVTSQVFHQTPLTIALVNLKPILPGHVLISPRRVVSRVADLTPSETSDLFLTVRRVGRMIERVYGASSLNIAVQDGVDAGQSVPHVHTHVIPRKRADLDHRGGTDAVYDMLDGEEGDVGASLRERERQQQEEKGQGRRFPVVDNEERKPRSMEEMEEEARMLEREMEREALD